jgi:hypothetical protein
MFEQKKFEHDRLPPRHTLRLLALFLTVVAIVLAAAGPASVALADEVHSVRCKRASDLKHWRCEVSCADGENGIANCPTQSDWGACGRSVLREACGITVDTPAVACHRKVVLAGSDLDALKSQCEASYAGVADVLEGPFEILPGLAYRSIVGGGSSDPSSGR